MSVIACAWLIFNVVILTNKIPHGPYHLLSQTLRSNGLSSAQPDLPHLWCFQLTHYPHPDGRMVPADTYLVHLNKTFLCKKGSVILP